MSRATPILVLRTTRANLNTQAAAAGLLAGENYLITDESRLAVALTTSTYQAAAKQTEILTAGGTTGQKLKKNSGTDFDASWVDDIATLTFVIDGGGSALTTGMKGYLEVPFGCTILQATLLADVSGSVVVDVFKCTYANFNPGTHPVSGDKITASAPPTISSTYKSQDATLTGWTTAITAGDILGFNVNSAATITKVTISLKVKKT